jgi:hypothetical protein
MVSIVYGSAFGDGQASKLPAPLRGIQHPIILFLDCCNILAKQRIVPATKET